MNAPKEIQRTMFLHPLVQIFLDLKWRKVRWLTWIGILFQVFYFFWHKASIDSQQSTELNLFTYFVYFFQQGLWLAMYTLMILEIYIPNCPNEPNNETSHVVDDSGSGEKKKSLKLFLSLGFARRDESSKKILQWTFFFSSSSSIVASTQPNKKMKSQICVLSCSACYLRNLKLFCELKYYVFFLC